MILRPYQEKAVSKRCPRCGETKGADAFGYRTGASSHLLNGHCRACCAARATAKRKADPQKHRDAVKRHRERHPGRVAARISRWRSASAEHVKAYRKRYHSENRGRILAKKKADYAADPEKFRQWCRRWYRKNKHRNSERYARHADKKRAARRAWLRSHRAEHRAHQAARHRLRVSRCADPAAVTEFYRFVATAPRLRCWWCKRVTAKGRRHVDHIVPLSRGGSHSRDNLCCSCARCNLRKSAKTPEEFTGQRRLL